MTPNDFHQLLLKRCAIYFKHPLSSSIYLDDFPQMFCFFIILYLYNTFRKGLHNSWIVIYIDEKVKHNAKFVWNERTFMSCVTNNNIMSSHTQVLTEFCSNKMFIIPQVDSELLKWNHDDDHMPICNEISSHRII
jgi:hypothetical protein